MQDRRVDELKKWVTRQLSCEGHDVVMHALPVDASFRRYFRISKGTHSFIAMDAPPDKENSVPFSAIGHAFFDLGLRVPKIFHEDLAEGFLLLEDFGNKLYLNVLNAENADALYHTAIADLLTLQKCCDIPGWTLPHFNHTMIGQELNLFMQWMIERYLNLKLSAVEEQLLRTTFQQLIDSAKQQPQVCVHRDYHSRNLMVLDDDRVGMLDFQDAVWGPVTYDLVSLIRDCYIDWPLEKVQAWALQYLKDAQHQHVIAKKVSSAEFLTWFDRMGVQRHLKASFIFARKWLRDQDPRYLADIPRTFRYVSEVTARDSELHEFHDFFSHFIFPRFTQIFNTHEVSVAR